VTCVVIVTDSYYVVENLPRAHQWKKQKWRNRHGEPKFNDDLWNRLLKLKPKIRVRVDFIWEKGKKSEITRLVDKAAKSAAKRGGLDVDIGYRPGGVSRSMVKDKSVAVRFDANGQIVVIRPYVKKVMHKGELRISFNIFDEAASVYHGKFFAFVEKNLGAETHLGNGYRVRFNTDSNYPQILESIERVDLPNPPRRRAKNRQEWRLQS